MRFRRTVTAGLDDSSRFYVRFSVKVRNIGGVRGKEVAQVYVKSPQGKLGKPVRSLVAFAKTRELDPGEEQKAGDDNLRSYAVFL